MCKRLEQQGFLQKKRDTKDERVVLIELTEKGERAITDIDRYINERIINQSVEKETITGEEFMSILSKQAS